MMKTIKGMNQYGLIQSRMLLVVISYKDPNNAPVARLFEFVHGFSIALPKPDFSRLVLQ